VIPRASPSRRARIEADRGERLTVVLPELSRPAICATFMELGRSILHGLEI
jgi:hypothetical protein